MSSIASAQDLLSIGILEMPEKDITLKCGKTVKIRALPGDVRLDNFGKPNSEFVDNVLKHGLVEPSLTDVQRKDFIKGAYSAATEISAAIGVFNTELDEASSKAREDAVKN
jgi:hypothetical protein